MFVHESVSLQGVARAGFVIVLVVVLVVVSGVGELEFAGCGRS